jgi:hypothetical protein
VCRGLALALRERIQQKNFFPIDSTGGFWRYNGRSKLIPDVPRFGYGNMASTVKKCGKQEGKGGDFSAQCFEKYYPNLAWSIALLYVAFHILFSEITDIATLE